MDAVPNILDNVEIICTIWQPTLSNNLAMASLHYTQIVIDYNV